MKFLVNILSKLAVLLAGIFSLAFFAHAANEPERAAPGPHDRPASSRPEPGEPLRPGWSRPAPDKMPSPTYWPMVFALGIAFFMWGLIANLFVLGLGFFL